MKVTSLDAENVHGYLPIRVDFFEDLTFLTGLNGSGKTSALRLLMALLTPNIEELGAIHYTKASVTVMDNEKEIRVTSTRSPDGVTLSLSTLEESLTISSAELELIHEAKRRDEPRSPIIEKYVTNNVLLAIRKMSTPMFLGLDRRFFSTSSTSEDITEQRRRDYISRRYWPEDPGFRNTTVAAGLMEVNFLVVSRMQEIRAEQEKLDERLRNEFFTKAFEYNPSMFAGNPSRLPSRAEVNRYKEQLAKIERAADGMRIPVPEIQLALTKFFERMSNVVEVLNKSTEIEKSTKKSKKKITKPTHGSMPIHKDYMEWIINKPQADRIVEHLQLLEKYIENRTSLRDPISRFLNLVNKFFDQTRKTVEVAPSGQLTVTIEGRDKPRPISALSSGERQLLVMLAHLSLNPNLIGSGVFIVDEPELSLHLDWQEKFVDAIREANPNVQLILATHSPGIILDRHESCRSLS